MSDQHAVVRHTDARSFLDRAEAWLLEREPQYHLLLGVANEVLAGDDRFDDPVYLATIERGGVIEGCAFRTPPHKLGITDLPVGALQALERDVGAVYDELPAVLGPEGPAFEFARLWTQSRQVEARVGMRQGVHALTAVVPPPNPPAGALRPYEEADRPLVEHWVDGFLIDTGHPSVLGRSGADRLISAGRLHLWDDGQPRSMVAALGPTPNGVRISAVYTPPQLRGRGYASAAVAAISQRMLDVGRRYCFLYTDLANPTSNSVYRKVGYEVVMEVADVEFFE